MFLNENEKINLIKLFSINDQKLIESFSQNLKMRDSFTIDFFLNNYVNENGISSIRTYNFEDWDLLEISKYDDNYNTKCSYFTNYIEFIYNTLYYLLNDYNDFALIDLLNIKLLSHQFNVYLFKFIGEEFLHKTKAYNEIRELFLVFKKEIDQLCEKIWLGDESNKFIEPKAFFYYDPNDETTSFFCFMISQKEIFSEKILQLEHVNIYLKK